MAVAQVRPSLASLPLGLTCQIRAWHKAHIANRNVSQAVEWWGNEIRCMKTPWLRGGVSGREIRHAPQDKRKPSIFKNISWFYLRILVFLFFSTEKAISRDLQTIGRNQLIGSISYYNKISYSIFYRRNGKSLDFRTRSPIFSLKSFSADRKTPAR